MRLRKQNFRQLLVISIVGHLIILSILMASFEFNSRNFVLENSKDQVINAVILDSSKFQKASPTPVAAKQREIIKKPEPPKKIIPAVTEPPPPTPVPQPVKKEVIPTLQKKVIAIPDKRKLQKDIEKQLLAELKQAKNLKKHKQIEKELQKELKDAKHAKTFKSQMAKSLEQELQSEQDRLASSQAQKMSGIVNKYKALILQAIAQHWLVPNGVNKNLSSQLLIRVSQGGTVLDVQLVKSSGDDALDRSARTAVFKASPLPVPADAEEFALFKEFILKVKPENVLARDNGLE